MKKIKHAKRVANYSIAIGILILIGNIIDFEGIPVVLLSIAFVTLGFLTKSRIKKEKPIIEYFIPLLIIWFIFAIVVLLSLFFVEFLGFLVLAALIAFPIYNSVKYYLAKDISDITEVSL